MATTRRRTRGEATLSRPRRAKSENASGTQETDMTMTRARISTSSNGKKKRLRSRKGPSFTSKGFHGFSCIALGLEQVWSLTQFYSVDFSQSRINVKKGVFSTQAQSRFASVVVDGVLGPPRLARHP